MADNEKQKISVEAAGLLTRLSLISGILALAAGLGVVILGMMKSDFAGSDTFTLALIPLALALLFSIGDFIYGILARAAADEDLEKILLAKRKESTHALDVEEDVRFTAGRTFANYVKYAPYVLNVAGALLCGIMVWLFWQHWGERLAKPLPVNSLRSAFVSVVLMGICAFIGAFFVGQARQNGFRWLRTVGAWFSAAFVTLLLAAAGSVLNHFKIGSADERIAKVLLVVFLVLGAEFIIGFIIEFYRPRTIVEERPLFESRLLSLFTEPGGVMRNIADTLDYQFGFKVSSTWIYSFVERALYPLIFLWVLLIWLATSVYDVGPDQVGFRTSFGRVEHELLDSGVYLALPWPFGSIRTVSCSEIHSVVVGGHGDEEEEEEEEEEDDGHGHSHGAKPKKHHDDVPYVVTWTQQQESHNHDFVVAAPPKAGDSRAMNVAMLSITVPVEYRIRRDGVFDYLFANEDSRELIRLFAESEVVRYLSSSTFDEILSGDRRIIAETLKRNIQKMTDDGGLGVEIVNVNVQHIHPPMGGEVSKKFEEIYIAGEQARIAVLNAESYRARTVPEAESAAMKLTAEARSYEFEVVRSAEAESRRFSAQLSAYEAMPMMFRLRSYLDFLENDCRGIRKFIVPAGLEKEIYELNFEVSPQLRLLDSGIEDISRKE